MIEVNLLPPQNVLSQKEKVLRWYLILAAVGGGAALMLVLFLIFLGHGFFTIRANLLSRQRASLTAELQNELDTVATLQVINDKVSGLKTIRAGRTDFVSILQHLSDLVALGAKIKSVSLGTGGTVQFGATVADSAVLKTVLANLSQTGADNYFSDTVVSGLREDQDKNLSFSVTAKFHE